MQKVINSDVILKLIKLTNTLKSMKPIRALPTLHTFTKSYDKGLEYVNEYYSWKSHRHLAWSCHMLFEMLYNSILYVKSENPNIIVINNLFDTCENYLTMITTITNMHDKNSSEFVIDLFSSIVDMPNNYSDEEADDVEYALIKGIIEKHGATLNAGV